MEGLRYGTTTTSTSSTTNVSTSCDNDNNNTYTDNDIINSSTHQQEQIQQVQLQQVVSITNPELLKLQYIQEENNILREVLYCLEGLDGQRIKFSHYIILQQQIQSQQQQRISDEESKKENQSLSSFIQSPLVDYTMTTYNNILPYSRLGSGWIDIICICCEIGILYKRIQNFIQHTKDPSNTTNTTTHINSTISCVARALGNVLVEEIQDYRTILNQFEYRLVLGTTEAKTEQDQQRQQPIYTLREIFIEIQIPFYRLKVLAMITDGLLYNQTSIIGSLSLSSLSLERQQLQQNVEDHPIIVTMNAFIILTSLYKHCSNHGDTRHVTIVTKLLHNASKPWYTMIYDWCTNGTLYDPINEFFIIKNNNTTTNTTNTTNTTTNSTTNNTRYLWQYGYQLDYKKVPMGLIELDLIDSIFIIGKGINYIRHCLHDGTWSIDSTSFTDSTNELLLKDVDNSIATTKKRNNLSSSIDEEENTSNSISSIQDKLGFCYTPKDKKGRRSNHHHPNNVLYNTIQRYSYIVHSHILLSLHNDYNLMQHLYALKQFLLLGQGDFFSALVDGLHTEYDNNEQKSTTTTTTSNTNSTSNSRRSKTSGSTKTKTIFPHTLSSILETALRSTNAISSFPQDIISRIHVTVQQQQPDEDKKNDDIKNSNNTNKNTNRNTIWDVFQLQYNLPDPIVAICHDNAMDGYNTMFKFLFQLKIIAYKLNLTWRQSAILQHSLHKQAQYMGITNQNNTQYGTANIVLRQIATIRQSMMHFVTNLKSYIMFEVLEGSWNDLVYTINNNSSTLDEVIDAHDTYLGSILRKSLLLSSNSNNNNNNNNTHVLAEKLQNLLQLASNFCIYQKELFTTAQIAADIAATKRTDAEQRLNDGDWGFEEIINESETLFFGLSDTTKLQQLYNLHQIFNNTMNDLLLSLDTLLNSNPAWMNTNETFISEQQQMFQTPTMSTPAAQPKTKKTQYHVNEYSSISDQIDIDSLRFLIFQLDFNNYYGTTTV